jgi:4-hydroxy-4-methyl-2-oxoglutarate aldolase
MVFPFFSLLILTGVAQMPEVSSSAVSEAVEQLTGRRAHLTSDLHPIAGTRLEGPAVTIHLVRDEKASGREEGLKVIKLIEGSPAGSVIVAVLAEDKDFAVFGSTFAMLAHSHRLGGFLVDGSVRDVTELRGIGLPTFARGAAPGSAGGHYRIDAIDVPVQCGGIDVRPGDYVVGDEDGVSIAPADRLREVMDAAMEWQTDKTQLLPLIAKYGSYLKAMQVRDGKGR